MYIHFLFQLFIFKKVFFNAEVYIYSPKFFFSPKFLCILSSVVICHNLKCYWIIRKEFDIWFFLLKVEYSIFYNKLGKFGRQSTYNKMNVALIWLVKECLYLLPGSVSSELQPRSRLAYFVTSNAVWVGSSSELHVTAAGPLMCFDLGFRDISSFQNYKNYGLNEIKIQIN